MRIGINCGHTISGTIGCGAVGRIDESKETRAVGYPLMEMLRRLGHTVIDCTNDRAGSVNGNLSEICRIANSQPLDMLVSIHFNSAGGRGTEVFTADAQDKACAKHILEALCCLGFKNRGIKDGSHLYVIRHTKCPSVLVETCFVDSDDVDLYKQIGAKKVAKTICYGITGKIPEDKEDLTMAQYEELKNRIDETANNLTNIVNDMDGKLEKLTHPMIYNYIDENMPDWARPTIQKLVDKGYLKGDGEGLNLDENLLRMLVINDRAGIYDK